MASIVTNILSGGLLGGISKVIDSIRGKSPEDAAALAALQEKYNEAFLAAQVTQRQADLQELQMQADVNKVEAASSNLFIAGWRPAVGWTCTAGLATQFIVRPLFTWVAGLLGHPIEFPSLDMGTLVTLLLGMLGIAGMRTAEKLQGAEGNR